MLSLKDPCWNTQEPFWCSPEASWIPHCGNRYRMVFPSDRTVKLRAATRFSAYTSRADPNSREALAKDSLASSRQERSISYKGESINVPRNPVSPWKRIPPHLLKCTSIMVKPHNIRQGCHKSLWKPQKLKIAWLSPPLGCRQRAEQGAVGYTMQHSKDIIIKSFNWITNHQTYSLRCSSGPGYLLGFNRPQPF